MNRAKGNYDEVAGRGYCPSEAHGKQKIKIFVGGLSIRTDEEQLYGYMSQFGRILDLNIMRASGKSKGFAFLIFENDRDALKICSISHSLHGKSFSCKVTKDEDWNYQKILEQKNRKIFVRDVPFNVNEADLEGYFSRFGEIERVTINKYIDETRKGTAFVLFVNSSSVEYILSMPSNLHPLMGKRMKVFECYTKKEVQIHTRMKNTPMQPLKSGYSKYRSDLLPQKTNQRFIFQSNQEGVRIRETGSEIPKSKFTRLFGTQAAQVKFVAKEDVSENQFYQFQHPSTITSLSHQIKKIPSKYTQMDLNTPSGSHLQSKSKKVEGPCEESLMILSGLKPLDFIINREARIEHCAGSKNYRFNLKME